MRVMVFKEVNVWRLMIVQSKGIKPSINSYQDLFAIQVRAV